MMILDTIDHDDDDYDDHDVIKSSNKELVDIWSHNVVVAVYIYGEDEGLID